MTEQYNPILFFALTDKENVVPAKGFSDRFNKAGRPAEMLGGMAGSAILAVGDDRLTSGELLRRASLTATAFYNAVQPPFTRDENIQFILPLIATVDPSQQQGNEVTS